MLYCSVLHHSEVISFNSGLSNAKILIIGNEKHWYQPKQPYWLSFNCNTQKKFQIITGHSAFITSQSLFVFSNVVLKRYVIAC